MNWTKRLWTKPAIRQFLKYVTVGCIVTGIDMSILYIFFHWLLVPIKLSVILGFMSGNISSFVFNKYYTFRNFSTAIFRQYAKYFVTSMTGLLWTVFLMSLFYESWGLFSSLTDKNYLLCKMLVAVLVMFWNFIIIRHWTLASYELQSTNHLSGFGKKNDCFLSVIIPAYNEEKRLPSTLQAVVAWLQQQDFNWDIFVVDDGSRDNTLQMLRDKFSHIEQLHIIPLGKNCGKGAAVKAGMLAADGEYRLFMDADHQIHINELCSFLPNANIDTVIIGSKYLQADISQKKTKISFSRRFVSRMGNLLIRLLFDITVKDTQCGFKLFPAQIAEDVFGLQKLRGFSFDVEILALVRLFNKQIVELPIILHTTEETRVQTVKDSISVFTDLIRIKTNIWKKKYTNQKLLNKEQ